MSTGRKSWELPSGNVQLIHFGRRGKQRLRTNILRANGEVFWEAFGAHWTFFAPKFAFAHNTSVNYAAGKTPYEIIFAAKPQVPRSVQLGLYCNKHHLNCSEFCTDLPPRNHDENSTKNELLQKLLRPQTSQHLLDQKRDFKRIYSSTFEQFREQTARSHAYSNRYKLGHHLNIGQKVPYENHRQDLSESQKLKQRLGVFTITKLITSTTYQIQDNKDPSVAKTVHRNHLVEYNPKEEWLPAMIEEFVPHDQLTDDFYERFLEK